ncbi:hypothetical protein T01_2772 [Trichinella spiralis]|uniref:Uncharacterized protein n=1 Tax=Trichinella spiralis TaxID=6334 RepID=A0A0V1B7V9_TRISP|nr:hypothetical protein T01_2772 [Trichinella spiralis]
MYNLWHAVWEIGHIIEGDYFGKIEEEAAAAAALLLKVIKLNNTIIAPRKMMMFLRNGLKVSSCDDYSFIAANNEPFGHIFTMVCSSLLCFLEEPVNFQS